ncbi:MAG: hypothetical protein HY695_37970 [Deltaproteobacteria bacterium]|nr:hypothetical protein [Deltaproteobacteria bacterium]
MAKTRVEMGDRPVDHYQKQLDLYNPEGVRSLLDQLLEDSRLYTRSKDFKDLLDFVIRLRNFAPFNAMLLQVQKPGLRYAASTRDWRKRFGRFPKEGARPLVILWSFGPVALVYNLLNPTMNGSRRVAPSTAPSDCLLRRSSQSRWSPPFPTARGASSARRSKHAPRQERFGPAPRRERPRDWRRYTVKRYKSKKAKDGDSWRHDRLTLKPVNSDFDRIVLTEPDEGSFMSLPSVEVLGGEA